MADRKINRHEPGTNLARTGSSQVLRQTGSEQNHLVLALLVAVHPEKEQHTVGSEGRQTSIRLG